MKKKLVLITAVCLLWGITSCGDNGGGDPDPILIPSDDPKPQTATIEPFEDLELIVKGIFTNAEWTVVAGKIEEAIKNSIEESVKNAPDAIKDAVFNSLMNRYSACETIFVEKTTEYTEQKATCGGKIIYLNFDVLDNEDLGGIISYASATLGSTHQWVWVITTPANKEETGLLTETCSRCNETHGTRISPKKNLEIGDTGPGGGIIFYRSDDFGFTMTDTKEICYYLEAAPADMDTKLSWVSSAFMPDLPDNDPLLWDNDYWVSFSIEGTQSAIGTGRKNTALILASDPLAPAAKACNDYNHNGKMDWFLPSHYELYELYQNIDFLSNYDEYSTHFSSTQNWPNSVALMINGWATSLGSSGIKWSANNVRAIRAF